MIIYTMVGHFTTTSSESGKKGFQGMIEVRPNPPKNLEDKSCDNVDIVLIDSEFDPLPSGFAAFNGLRMEWDNSVWTIVHADSSYVASVNSDHPEILLFIERVDTPK